MKLPVSHTVKSCPAWNREGSLLSDVLLSDLSLSCLNPLSISGDELGAAILLNILVVAVLDLKVNEQYEQYVLRLYLYCCLGMGIPLKAKVT